MRLSQASPYPATLQAGTIPARAVIFFYLFNSLYLWKRNAYKQLQFYSVKKRNSQITNKNETQRKKGKRTKKRKNAIVSFLRCMKKYTVLA